MSKRKQPLQSRSRDRVTKIIQATRELVLTTEINDITTSLIAKNAGIPVGSIYQYFEDKNDILLTLADQVIDEQDQYFKKLFEDVSAHAHWRHVVKVVQDAFIQISIEDVIYRRLSRSLAWTKEWNEINRISTNRMVDYFSGYAVFAEKGLTENQARNTVRIIITMTTAISRSTHDLATDQAAKQLLQELPKMTIAYLATILGD